MGQGREELLLQVEQVRKNVANAVAALEKFFYADNDYRDKVKKLAAQEKPQDAKIEPKGKSMTDLLNDIEANDKKLEEDNEAGYKPDFPGMIKQGRDLLEAVDKWKNGGCTPEDKKDIDNKFYIFRGDVRNAFGIQDYQKAAPDSIDKLKDLKDGKFEKYDLSNAMQSISSVSDWLSKKGEMGQGEKDSLLNTAESFLHLTELQMAAAKRDIFVSIFYVMTFFKDWDKTLKNAESADKKEEEDLNKRVFNEAVSLEDKTKAGKTLATLEEQLTEKLEKWTKAGLKEVIEKQEEPSEKPPEEKNEEVIPEEGRKEEQLVKPKKESVEEPENNEEEIDPSEEEIEEIEPLFAALEKEGKITRDERAKDLTEEEKALREKSAKAYEEAKGEYDSNTSQIEKDYESGMKQARDDDKRRTEDAEYQYSLNKRTAKDVYEMNLQDAQNNYDVDMKNAQKQYDSEMKDLQSSYDDSVKLNQIGYNEKLKNLKESVSAKLFNTIIPEAKEGVIADFREAQDEILNKRLEVQNHYKLFAKERSTLEELTSKRRSYENRIKYASELAGDLYVDLNNFVAMYDKIQDESALSKSTYLGLVSGIKTQRDLLREYYKQLSQNIETKEGSEFSNIDGEAEKLLSGTIDSLHKLMSDFLVKTHRAAEGTDNGLTQAGQNIKTLDNAEGIAKEAEKNAETNIRNTLKEYNKSHLSTAVKYGKNIIAEQSSILDSNITGSLARDLFFICRKYDLQGMVKNLSPEGYIPVEKIENQKKQTDQLKKSYDTSASILSGLVAGQEERANGALQDVETEAKRLFYESKEEFDKQYDDTAKKQLKQFEEGKKKQSEILEGSKKEYKESLDNQKKEAADRFAEKNQKAEDDLKKSKKENKELFEKTKENLAEKREAQIEPHAKKLDEKMRELDEERLANDKANAEQYNQGVLDELAKAEKNLKKLDKDPFAKEVVEKKEIETMTDEQRSLIPEQSKHDMEVAKNILAMDNNDMSEDLEKDVKLAAAMYGNDSIREDDEIKEEEQQVEIYKSRELTPEEKRANEERWNKILEEKKAKEMQYADPSEDIRNRYAAELFNSKNYLMELARLAKALDATKGLFQNNSKTFNAFGTDPALTELKNISDFENLAGRYTTRKDFMGKYFHINKLCKDYAEEHKNASKYPKLKGYMPKRLRIMARMINVLKMASTPKIAGVQEEELNPYSPAGREMMLKEKYANARAQVLLNKGTAAQKEEARKYLLDFGSVEKLDPDYKVPASFETVLRDIRSIKDDAFKEKEYLKLLTMDAQSFFTAVTTGVIKIEKPVEEKPKEKSNPQDLLKKEIGGEEQAKKENRKEADDNNTIVVPGKKNKESEKEKKEEIALKKD